jgi:hypothetical protein
VDADRFETAGPSHLQENFLANLTLAQGMAARDRLDPAFVRRNHLLEVSVWDHQGSWRSLLCLKTGAAKNYQLKKRGFAERFKPEIPSGRLNLKEVAVRLAFGQVLGHSVGLLEMFQHFLGRAVTSSTDAAFSSLMAATLSIESPTAREKSALLYYETIFAAF